MEEEARNDNTPPRRTKKSILEQAAMSMGESPRKSPKSTLNTRIRDNRSCSFNGVPHGRMNAKPPYYQGPTYSQPQPFGTHVAFQYLNPYQYYPSYLAGVPEEAEVVMDVLGAASYRVYSVLGGTQCSQAVYSAIDWYTMSRGRCDSTVTALGHDNDGTATGHAAATTTTTRPLRQRLATATSISLPPVPSSPTPATDRPLLHRRPPMPCLCLCT
ncbi:uncharacterized protein G2W53_013893 [Senna tora]|uniref:Uncharacterized protein n=1 Tax=Senna tora TaxID=362788 RepID=A0A834WPT7_9FABA|nr:uncharacterized protein G2W53_013893 [Senna tora]